LVLTNEGNRKYLDLTEEDNRKYLDQTKAVNKKPEEISQLET